MIKNRYWIWLFIDISLTRVAWAENFGVITVDLTPEHPANTFLPDEAFGAGLVLLCQNICHYSLCFC